MFDDFIQRKIETSETEINLVIGGRGKAVLVLHGYPQTHVCCRQSSRQDSETSGDYL